MKKLLLSFLTLLMLGGSLAWGGALTISGTLTIQGGAPLPENIHLSFGNSSYAGTVTINGSNYTASMSYGVYLYSGYATPFKFGLGGSSALFDQSELSPDWFFVDASGNEVNPLEVNLAEEDVEIEQISEYEKNYTYTLNLTIKPRIKKDITVSGAITINGDVTPSGIKLLMGNAGDPSSLQEFDLSAATYSATLKEGEILFALGATGESGFLSGNNGNLSRDWFFVNGTRSVNPLAVEASEDLTQDLVIKQKTGVTLTGSLTQSVKYEPDWALGTKVFLTDGTTIWESSLEMFYSPEVHLQYTFEDVQPGTYMLSNYSVLQVYEGGYVDKRLVAESQVTVAKADVTHNLVAAEDNSMVKVRFKPFANNAPHPVYGPGTLTKVYLDAEVTVTKNSNKASSKANSGLGCESGCGGNDGATADLYMQKNTPYTLVVRADGYKTYTDENYTVSSESYGYTTIEMQAGNDDDEPTATVIGKVLNGGTSNKECFDAYENVTVTLSNADESFKKTSPIIYDYNTFESLGGECYYGYKFDTVPLGEYTLTYAKDGYDTETQTINLTEAKVYKADPVTLEWAPEDFEFTGQLSYQHALDGTVFLNNAVITAYADEAQTQSLATTRSDASGNWTLTVHVRRSSKVYFGFTHDKIYPCTAEKEAAYNSQGTKVTLTVSPQIVEKQPEKLGLASCSLQQTGNKLSPKVKISWTYPQELIDNYRTSTGGGTYSIEKIKVSRRIGDNTLIEIGSVAADNNHTLPATSFMDENDREGDYRLQFDQQVTYQLDIVYTYPTGTYSVSGDPNLTITLSLANAPLDSFNIEVAANNADWGTVTGGGRYVEGKTVSVGATPNDGYKFVGWNEDETQVSDANPYTFTIAGNRTLTAVFTYDTVELTLLRNNDAMGTVTGAGKYRKNENATATATANDGYKFVAWKEGNTQVSTANPYTFKITGNRTLTAVFTYDTVELTLLRNNDAMGTVTGAGKYRKNENATATATANDGYKFVAWKEGNTQVSTANPYTFKITGNRTLTAVFTYDTVELTLQRNDANMGTVTGNGKYRKNENATATATANDGYKFVAWKEGNTQVSTANPYTFKITANRTLTAVFTYDTVELALQPNNPDMGTVTGAGKYRKNENATARATANDGYKFVAWKEGNTQVSTANPYTFKITANRTLTAVFTYDTVELTLERNDANMGTVTGNGKYRKNENATARATANDGYKFVAWKEGNTQVSTANPYTFTITANRTLTAVFTYDTVELTIQRNNATMGTVTGNGKYRKNENATATATANDGYKFVAWKEGNTQVSTANPYTFKITANRTLTAVFTYDTVELTLERNDANMGTVTGNGKYRKNENATARATANDGYKFVAWKEGNTQVSIANPYTFTITANRTLTAVFTYDTVELTLERNDANMGAVTGAGKYRKNHSVTATATANDGYKFVAWKEGETQVSTDAEYTFKITGNRTLTAVFTYDTVELTLQPNDPDMGTVTGEGKYRKNHSVTARATANDGYKFVAWKEGETQVSTANPYTFKITANRTLTAVFTYDTVELTLQPNNPDMGTVTGEGKYRKNQMVTVKATANDGYKFVAWKNGNTQVSTKAEYEFKITANRTLTAVFTYDTVTLTLRTNDANMGSVTGGGKYRKNNPATAKATAKDGYVFVGWNENGAQISTENPYEFTITGNRTLTAMFKYDTVELTLQPNDPTMGTVTGAGKYRKNENATATATAYDGYKFVNWKEGNTQVSTKAEYEFKITGNRTFTAVFKYDTVTLTLQRNDPDMGTVAGGGKYRKNHSVKITATPAENHVFVAWKEGETVVSTENPYTFNITSNRTLKAFFQPDSVTLNLSVGTPGRGTVEGAAKYQKGEEVSISAIADYAAGFVFDVWKNGEEVFSQEADTTFLITQDMNLAAYFKHDSVDLVLSPNDPAKGRVEGAGSYRRLQSVTIKAIPNTGYRWKEWRENDTVVRRAASATHTFTIQRNRNLVAVFVPDSVTLNLGVNDAAMGSVSGNGRYKRGTTARVKATPNPNYVFVKWVEQDTTVLDSRTGLAAAAEFITKQLYNDRTLKAVFKRDSAVLTVKPNNAELGSATGGGKYAKGQSVTVTATAIGDNEFLGWRKNNGETVNTDASYTFTFTGTLTLTAHFKVPDPDSSMLTLTVNDPDMGTADARGQVGGAKFEAGETVEITATPNTGYKFIEWQEGGTQLSTDNPYEVEIAANNDRSITAVFAVKPDSVNLTLRVNNEDWGIAEGEARYQKGESVVITATPSEDYVFVGWKDNSGLLKSTEETYRFTIESDLTLTAYFQPDSMDLALEVNEARMGAVAGAGRYRKGQEVTITATPNDGYAFVEWKNGTEQFSDEREHTFEIDENLTLKAFFKPDSVMLSLDVNDPAMGKVTGAGRYRRGAKVKITAIPDTGYKFVAWKEGETEVSTNAAHTTKELTADRSLKAYFEADPVQLTLTVDDVAAGTVQGEGTYLRNKPVVIKAIANPGYRFVAWVDEEGNDFATEAEYRFNIKKTRTLKAVFVKQVTLTLTPDDPDRGTVDGSGTYDKDANATATATANEGYEFVGWQEDGAIVSNDAEYTLVMEADRTLTAIFAEKQVKLTLHANNDDWGSVEGEDTYGKGASVTAKAIPSDGYEFVKWMEGETQVSTEVEYTFIITADRTLTAVFAERKVRLTLEVNNSAWGTVEGAKAYEKGTQVTAKATANEGYEFVEWLEDEAQVSIEAEYTFTIEADRMLTAVFAEKAPVVKDSVNLTLEVNNAAMGTVEGMGKYEKGTQVTIKATANEGYVFEAWKAGETEISKEAEYTFVINSDSTLKAFFAAKPVDPVVKDSVNLTLEVNNAAMGTVEGMGRYEKGTQVTIKATANEGYVFEAWKAGETEISKEAEYTFVINSDSTLKAFFATKPVDPVVKDSVNLTLEVNNAAMGKVEGTGRYEKGSQVTIKATANEGYVFEAWKAGETEISKEAEYTFIINSDSALTAVFAEKAPVVEQVRLTLNANNSNWGTVEGADTYNKGASATAKATANEGYEFKGWQENGATVSTEAEYTFIINADRTLTAVFAEKAPVVEQVRLTLKVNNSAWGTVEGADTYNKGASVTAKATPNEGYEFKGWQENGATVSTEAEYTFIINADRTLTAVFAAKTANEDREQAAWSAYADNQTIVLRSEVACRYEIYTVSGKKVGQGRSNGKEYRITVNNGGLYIVRRIAANGIATKKVVVW